MRNKTDDHAGAVTPADNTPTKESLPSSLAGDAPGCTPDRFIGSGPAMRALFTIIDNAAASKAAVFITGESGTGKDICAQTIHRLSPRRTKPFVALNCAAIPHDLIESELFGHVKGAFTGATDHRDGAIARAEGGTLFLDEICDMPAAMQSKLLRFLQDFHYTRLGDHKIKRADIRIMCATNKDPADEISRGRFRDDLYYRLHVVPIAMPPLRGRADDILDLADYFLHLYAKEENKPFKKFSAAAEDFMVRYPWPGNVRELQNIIRYSIVLYNGVEIEADMLASQLKTIPGHMLSLPPSPAAMQPLWLVEKQAIEQAIAACGGNIPKAAALLEISPSTIYRKKQSWEQRP